MLSAMDNEAGRRPAARRCALLAALALAACSASDTKAPGTSAPAAVTRTPIPAPPAPAPGTTPAPGVAVVVPPDALYVCVTNKDGKPQQTAIEFVDKVGDLCRRHPEMGPCQYERNACRGRGGRVYAAGGVEITNATEAEYDKKVSRTRFRAN